MYIMSSITLPKELNYSEVLPSIGEATNTSHYLLPVNGSSFSTANSGSVIQWDLPNSGFFDPTSLYIKYKYQISSTGNSDIRGLPYTAPFSRLQIMFGSSIIENISSYNVIQHMLSNCQLNTAQKQGNSVSYGYKLFNNEVGSAFSCNGRNCVQNEQGFFSGPLPCILSSSEKMLPLGLMPNCRVQIYLESLNNIFSGAQSAIIASDGIAASNATVLPTEMMIYDVQLCYNTVSFGNDVENVVRNMAEKLYIKSSSWSFAASTLPIGSSGTLAVVYNQRLASVKSVFVHTSSNSTNGLFDSYNLGQLGDVQFDINGKQYPSRPVQQNDVIPQLKLALGSIAAKSNSLSIDNNEFGYALGTATTIQAPSKQYVGVNTEIVPFSNVLLNGKSTQASPITVRFSIPTPTVAVAYPSLICYYDALIEIDPNSKNASVKL